MVWRARGLGLRVALVDVLPWSNGDSRAAKDIDALNAGLRALAERVEVPLFPFHDTLADPSRPHRMRDDLTDDGEHPSVEGHRLLGERAFSSLLELERRRRPARARPTGRATARPAGG